jgi:hypothetical protein
MKFWRNLDYLPSQDKYQQKHPFQTVGKHIFGMFHDHIFQAGGSVTPRIGCEVGGFTKGFNNSIILANDGRFRGSLQNNISDLSYNLSKQNTSKPTMRKEIR